MMTKEEALTLISQAAHWRREGDRAYDEAKSYSSSDDTSFAFKDACFRKSRACWVTSDELLQAVKAAGFGDLIT